MIRKELKCPKQAEYKYYLHITGHPHFVCTEHLVMISAAARMEGRKILFYPLEQEEMTKNMEPCGQIVYVFENEEENGKAKDDPVSE